MVIVTDSQTDRRTYRSTAHCLLCPRYRRQGQHNITFCQTSLVSRWLLLRYYHTMHVAMPNYYAAVYTGFFTGPDDRGMT